MNQSEIEVNIITQEEANKISEYDIDEIIYDYDSQIDMLSSHADKYDYIVSIASGLLCGCLDLFWNGEFNLSRGRAIACDEAEKFVINTAKKFGCKKVDLQSAVKFLEKKFPIPSDGNTPGFGGGLQHHLRDFSHHPTILGLIFSMLTQFTGKTYGTDTFGKFIILDVPESSKIFIGQDPIKKIIYGTFYWFFHLVSDMAGSSASAGISGGTGIPGPILSMAKELSALPVFKNNNKNLLSEFLAKLFNGTIFMKRDASGNIIKESIVKTDLRGELGVGVELLRQSIPVIANECIVRIFYFLRRLLKEIKNKNIRTLDDFKKIDWDKVKPAGSPTLKRMLTVSWGVYTSVNVTAAIMTKKVKLVIRVGNLRFLLALTDDVKQVLKVRDVKKIKQIYQNIKSNTFSADNKNIYEKTFDDNFTFEQLEILYNLQFYKTYNDYVLTKKLYGKTDNDTVKLKQEWLIEWTDYIQKIFSSFNFDNQSEIHWYTKQELRQKIKENNPKEKWFKIVLIETMVFEPYFPLNCEKDKNGNTVPSKKYKALKIDKTAGDKWLRGYFSPDIIKTYRECYKKAYNSLDEVKKAKIKGVVTFAAVSALAFIPSAGPLAAVRIVNITKNALLAGRIAGVTLGAHAGNAVYDNIINDKKAVIIQSAKLITAVENIWLNKNDIEYCKYKFKEYVRSLAQIKNYLSELKNKEIEACEKEKKGIETAVRKTEEIVKIMKNAEKYMYTSISNFEANFK